MRLTYFILFFISLFLFSSCHTLKEVPQLDQSTTQLDQSTTQVHQFTTEDLDNANIIFKRVVDLAHTFLDTVSRQDVQMIPMDGTAYLIRKGCEDVYVNYLSGYEYLSYTSDCNPVSFVEIGFQVCNREVISLHVTGYMYGYGLNDVMVEGTFEKAQQVLAENAKICQKLGLSFRGLD